MRKVFLLLIASLCFSVAAQNFPGIETLMTERERAASGVDSLSARELEALNAWLGNYLGDETVETTPVVESIPAVPSAPVAPPSPAVPPEQVASPAPAPEREYGAPPPAFQGFTSTIKGEFTGWTGNTRFELENGQVYEQRRPGRWRISLMNPEVRISRNFLGAYEMEVISEERSIGVRRLR